MATQTTTTTTNNTGDVRMREKKVTSSKQNGNVRGDDIKSLSTPATASTTDEMSTGETTTSTKTQASTFEQAFFFGLTIDDAINSTENLLELFYNACKYNHLELIKHTAIVIAARSGNNTCIFILISLFYFKLD
jgi:hypothetical protein